MTSPWPIAAFFVLSCAVSWAGILGNHIWPSDAWPVPVNPFGPILAAPIVIAVTEGRAGLSAWWRRICRFRAPARVYAASFFIPLAIIVISFGLTVAKGARIVPLPDYAFLDVVLIAVAASLFGPIPEEPSFRGYGMHGLRSFMSPLAASLVVGACVMVWHLPLIATGELPLTILMPLAGVAVVYGWLYRSGGSVWPLVVLHAQLNIVSATVTGPMMPDPADQATYIALLGLFYLAWAAALILRLGPSLGMGIGETGSAATGAGSGARKSRIALQPTYQGHRR